MEQDYTKIVEKIRSSIAIVFAIDSNNQVHSKGSGFIFLKKGILVTCNHVVSDPDTTILLRFPDKKEDVMAKVVVRDEEHDLALLKFENKIREPLASASSKEIKEGMKVVFSGYPLDLLSLTTHQGILSAIIEDATGIATYLIDGTVNSGNSGCPLMTTSGKVIGVVNAKRREQSNLLKYVEGMPIGAVSLHGMDLVQVYKAIIDNLQLGIGYAVPSAYIPRHKGSEVIKKNE